MDGRRIERPPGGPLRATVVSEGVHIHLGIDATRSAVFSEASARALSSMMGIFARQIVEITGKASEWETRGISLENVMDEAANNMAWAANITMMQPTQKQTTST